MEELAEGVIRFVLRVAGLAVRSALALIFEYCFEVLGWYAGWPVCRTLTLGNYPKESIHEQDAGSSWSSAVVSLVGVVFLVALAAFLARTVGEI